MMGLQRFAMEKGPALDLLLILDGAISLQDAIKIKSMKAVENNDFFVPLSALI